MNVLIWLWKGLNINLSIPIWSLLFGTPLLLAAVPLIKYFRKEPEVDLPFLRYRKENLFDINWYWDYSLNPFSEKWEIKDLTHRCVECGSRVEINNYSYEKVICINDECKWVWNRQTVGAKISNSDELFKKLHNVIDRKISNGEYLKDV